MVEMHLRQPEFTYSSYGPFTKIKERTQEGDSRYIYRNMLEKAYVQLDMAYGGFKYLPRKAASDKILRDKAFNIAINSKCNEYQRALASMIYKFFDKKSASDGSVKNEIKQNKKLTKELFKPINRKLKKRKVPSSFKNNI